MIIDQATVYHKKTLPAKNFWQITRSFQQIDNQSGTNIMHSNFVLNDINQERKKSTDQF